MKGILQIIPFIICLFTFQFSVFAQDITVNGTVRDATTGESLVGVNVVVKESPSIGVTTDLDGNYSIKLKPEWQSLIFSFIGYEPSEELISGRSTIDISLEEAAVGLDQVIVSASKRKEKVLNAPASVSIITAEKIQNQTSLTAVDNLKKTPGVDIMSTGLVSANVNLRGFNGIFDGSMLTMVDNRIGRVPSLRVNAFQLIPGNNYDIEKIEVVRGPGSALYGPNAADGVMHIITKSPIDIDGKQETSVSLTTGLRRVAIDGPVGADFEKGDFKTVIKPEIRTAIKFSDKVGLKLSGRYMKGQDWEYYDAREPVIGQTMAFGTVRNGEVWEQDLSIDTIAFDRDFTIENYNGDFRLDIRPTKDTEIIFAGGLSSSKNLELTGLGAGQSRGWQYWYSQARFRYKEFYAQYFINASNAGDETYLIPQGTSPGAVVPAQLLVDKSKLHVVQLQHNINPIDPLKLIYGVDVLLTRPQSEGTINGRFEDEDNFNQYGGYVQGEYEFTPQWKVVAAGRVDYHDAIKEVQVSPRAGLVYKPAENHTLRATYNRAFSTPSSLSLSLDLANGIHPLWNGFGPNTGNPFNPNSIQMNIRGIGNPSGYSYSRDGETGDLLYTNFWDNQAYTLDNNTDNNHTYFNNIISIVEAQLTSQAPSNLQAAVPIIINSLFAGIKDSLGTIQNAQLAGLDFVEYLETGDAAGSLWNGDGDLSNLDDFDNQKSEITETYELGYKGMYKSKFFLTIDGWYTQKKNMRSALLNKSPFIIFNPNDIEEIFGTNEEGQTFHDNLAGVETFVGVFGSSLAELFEGNEDYVVDANGDAFDEIYKIIQDANAQIGLGLVTPSDDKVNDDMILTYVNLGDVDIWGADFGFTYLINKNIQLGGSYSFVNRDAVELSTGGTVSLNAPKNKFSIAWDQMFEKPGIGYGINYRWYQGFPGNSAVYVGDVPTYNTLDAKVFYRPKKLENFQLTVDVSNLVGKKYRSFPGTPLIGRMGYVKLAYTFK